MSKNVNEIKKSIVILSIYKFTQILTEVFINDSSISVFATMY